MKNQIIIAILTLIPLIGYSQEYEYVPFPDSGVIWSEVYQPPVDYHDLTLPDPIYERFALNGEDTIINDTTYKKMYVFYDTIFNKNDAMYIGGIREDNTKKIFFRGDTMHTLKPSISYSWDIVKPNTEEILLYDFSLDVGDTLKTGNLSMPDEYLVVSSIDTIIVSNTLRKKYNFESIYWVKWIEGIGSLKGLLFTSGDLPFNGLNDDLICFKQNNEILYFNNKYNMCFPQLTSVDTKKDNESKVYLYPNPSKNADITFNFDEQYNITNIEIMNCNGSVIENFVVNKKSTFILSTEKYKPGIYFYIASSRDGMMCTGKFVIL